jgi:hypothetical protein
METGNQIEYDINYYEGLLKLQAKTGEDIARRRWNFLGGINFGTVLDFGSGAGFFRIHRPEGLHVDSFDIMPVPQTGIQSRTYDLICFWDVLEHLPSFEPVKQMLDMKKVKFVAATVPIVPDKEGFFLKDWKHYKPGEHLHYFTKETFELLFDSFGFRLIKHGTPECPPRQDAETFLFERVAPCEK